MTARYRFRHAIGKVSMIRKCTEPDTATLFDIINTAAQAYKGTIPDDRRHDPCMPRDELLSGIGDGVLFRGHEHDGRLCGIMGFQEKADGALIRHACIYPARQQQGIGSALLQHLEQLSEKPILIGTWAAAVWAIRFYENNGCACVNEQEKNRRLKTCWSIPDRRIETSVVLADAAWFSGSHLPANDS